MKPLLTVVLLATLLGAGCARHYTLTLSNGNRITAQGKPQLKNGFYYYKDAKGQPGSVAAGRVQELSPSSMTSSRVNSGFKAEPTR